MSDERELERHNRIIDRIRNAKTKEELPKVVNSQITSFLSTSLNYKDVKVPPHSFRYVVEAIIDYGNPTNPKVVKKLENVLSGWHLRSGATKEELSELCIKALSSKRVEYVLAEMSELKAKLDELENEMIDENHKQMMKDIKSTYEIKDLPKVGLSELNIRLVRAVNSNSFDQHIKTSEIKELTEAYLKKSSYKEIEEIVYKLCSKYCKSEEEIVLMKEQIIAALRVDNSIEYIAEEIDVKEKRKLTIYKLNHEETMENIKNATRISQLPPQLTSSAITSYLNGNTTIYTNDDRVTVEDMKRITELLLKGFKIDGVVITTEINEIAKIRYPEKEDAFKLLYDKLSSLPRLEYLVEEVKFASQRQKEFIGRGGNNVNVYFIPNDKSPIDGGRFYNCYINRVDNLDLEKILPLDLSTIVPPEMDIDSIEWYVQEYYDETFKTAGGIILNRDETIGNVSVFKPNDGKVGVSVEEKEKMDEIDSLDTTIGEKKALLEQLENEITEKQNESTNAEEKIKKLVSNYERKALELQKELIESIKELQEEFSISDQGTARTRKNNMV